MKKPCKECPFRRDIEPYLTPERGEELAAGSGNPYNSFICHKTGLEDDEGNIVVENEPKECAGFIMLQHIESETTLPDGFTMDYDAVFESYFHMEEHYKKE